MKAPAFRTSKKRFRMASPQARGLVWAWAGPSVSPMNSRLNPGPEERALPLPDGSSPGVVERGSNAIRIRVDGADQVGEARRASLSMASGLQFDEAQAARAALIATELASNIWR